MEVDGQRHVPATLPLGKTRYPLHKRLSGTQSRCGRVRNISPSLGFDPSTVQSVTSYYTDYAIPAQNISSYVYIYTDVPQIYLFISTKPRIKRVSEPLM
jgi:hypothetical protein